MRPLPLLLSLLTLITAGSGAPNRPSSLQALPTVSVTPYEPPAALWAKFIATPINDTYGVYSATNGAKFGWMGFTMEMITEEKSKVLRMVETYEYEYTLENTPFSQRARREYYFDGTAPFALRRAVMEETLQKETRSMVLTRTGDGEYHAVIKEAGESRTKNFSNLQLTAIDRVGVRLWARSEKRQRGDCQTFRAFDLKTLEPYNERHCLLTPAVNEAIAEVEVEDLKDRFRSQYSLSKDGQVALMVVAGTTRLVLESPEKAKAPAAAPDIIADSLLPSNRALGPRGKLPQELTFTLTGPGLREIPNTRYQKVTSNPTGTEITIQTGPKMQPPVPATPEETKANLKGSALLPIDDSRVKRLARQAVGEATGEVAKVRALLKFVCDFIIDDARVKSPTLIGLLKQPKGDCTAHAMLFTALARASGIPCREASGYIYLGDEQQAFGGHAWNEVVIDGRWYPVDPTWNEFVINATHIQLSTGPPTAKDSQFFSGQIKLRVE